MARIVQIKNFSIKFIDIMIGIVLGLGFQWWINLKEPWQYVAFIFSYVDIVDYWIDYGPSLKKFPPKREIDVFLDLAICFSLFLYIYSAQLSVIYFLMAFAFSRLLDFFWLLSSKHEYNPVNSDKKFIDTWLITDGMEVVFAVMLIFFYAISSFSSLAILLVFIGARIVSRIIASISYKKVYLPN